MRDIGEVGEGRHEGPACDREVERRGAGTGQDRRASWGRSPPRPRSFRPSRSRQQREPSWVGTTAFAAWTTSDSGACGGSSSDAGASLGVGLRLDRFCGSAVSTASVPQPESAPTSASRQTSGSGADTHARPTCGTRVPVPLASWTCAPSSSPASGSSGGWPTSRSGTAAGQARDRGRRDLRDGAGRVDVPCATAVRRAVRRPRGRRGVRRRRSACRRTGACCSCARAGSRWPGWRGSGWSTPRSASGTCRVAPRPAGRASSGSPGAATTRRGRPTRRRPTTRRGSSARARRAW